MTVSTVRTEAYQTPQEAFWAGEFGTQYIERNQSAQLLASNTAFFAEVFGHTGPLSSLIEFGANIGMNMQAIERLQPTAELSAIEINHDACQRLRELEYVTVHEQSLLEFKLQQTYDFALIKGVLIHINPESLATAYQQLYDASSRYICVAEYYNPTPVEVNYRGHEGRLFKRDFAGEMLDRYDDLELVTCGFSYRRAQFPQDDMTWFLMKKTT
jgi:pseudaminic acid biosynthesis-associated methylase